MSNLLWLPDLVDCLVCEWPHNEALCSLQDSLRYAAPETMRYWANKLNLILDQFSETDFDKAVQIRDALLGETA